MDKCPAKKTPDKFNEFVGPTTAINIPFPQAIPKKATINAEFCRKLTSGKCGVCAKVCPTGAMDPKTLLWDMEKCISCMACVSRCPVGALGYNSAAIATRLTEKFSERRPVEVFL